jgi:UDP-glucose 4-epimerase
MSYLVTGGAGFIGSHLVEALVARGAAVTVLDNLSSGYERNLAAVRDRITFVQGDVRDTAAVARAMQGCRFVFHEAALVSVFDSVARPRDNHDINLTGTLNVLEAARTAKVERLVMACTAAAYGNDPTLPKHEGLTPVPESPYGLAKVASEYYLRLYATLYGVPTVGLRYFNVYGPRQDPSSAYSGVISKFTSVLTQGQTPTIFGDGQQSRDFIFVKDIVAGNLLAMHSDRVGAGEIINLATGQATTLLELLGTLGRLTGRPAAPVFKPARAGDVRHSVASIARARELLGFAPRHTLEEGLRQLLAALP